MNENDRRGIKNAFKRVSRDMHYLDNERNRLTGAVLRLAQRTKNLERTAGFHSIVIAYLLYKVHENDIKYALKRL